MENQAERRHFFTQLQGIFHDNDDGTSRQSIIRTCTAGEELTLIREVNNPRDPNAIKVCRMVVEKGAFDYSLAEFGWTTSSVAQGVRTAAPIRDERKSRRVGPEPQ